MTTSVLARCTVLCVALVGIAATLATGGNARGELALATRCAMRGDEDAARCWLQRGAQALRRRGCFVDDGIIVAPDLHAFERVLEFEVRDDAARAWWRARMRTDRGDQSRVRCSFVNPLRPGR